MILCYICIYIYIYVRWRILFYRSNENIKYVWPLKGQNTNFQIIHLWNYELFCLISTLESADVAFLDFYHNDFFKLNIKVQTKFRESRNM